LIAKKITLNEFGGNRNGWKHVCRRLKNIAIYRRSQTLARSKRNARVLGSSDYYALAEKKKNAS